MTSNIVKALGMDILEELFTDRYLIGRVIDSSNVKAMAKIVATPGFTYEEFQLLDQSCTVEMINYLLKNVVNLKNHACIGKYIPIAKFILSDTLKYPIDPNMILPDGKVFWHTIYHHVQVEREKLMKYTGPNFTVPIDINAKNSVGNTFCHAYPIFQDFLDYKPDPFIKNNEGLDAMTQVEINGSTSAYLRRYVETLTIKDNHEEELKELKKELAKTKDELEKFKARSEEIKKVLQDSSSSLSS